MQAVEGNCAAELQPFNECTIVFLVMFGAYGGVQAVYLVFVGGEVRIASSSLWRRI